jgi:radical SAM protein with 4Fe4S-binding SPASM domain
VAYVAVSGGEPLMRKDFFEVAKRIVKHGMAFSIATNGVLLTKESAKKLADLHCLYVQVSVDGSNAASHNWFRGVNAFEKTMVGIKNALAEGLTVGISMTVTSHNYKEVPAAIALAEKLGCQFFMHYNFIPVGRGKGIQNLDITPEQREDMLKKMAAMAGKRKIKVLSTAPQYGRVCVENEALTIAMTHFDYTGPEMTDSVKFLADFIGGCGTARLYCAMEPNGDIEPCVFIPIKLGNIKTDDLLDIWHNSDVINRMRRRQEFSGKCGACEFRSVCGGCRARAFAYFNDVQACDPGCIRNKEDWDKITKAS